MKLRNPAARTALRPVLIGIGSFSTTILLILGTHAQGLAILA
ncbi:hypothetical protein [Sphingomonas sp. AX6]|nr:hypothetical protein [Sphingomonas sp. AX6]